MRQALSEIWRRSARNSQFTGSPIEFVLQAFYRPSHRAWPAPSTSHKLSPNLAHKILTSSIFRIGTQSFQVLKLLVLVLASPFLTATRVLKTACCILLLSSGDATACIQSTSWADFDITLHDVATPPTMGTPNGQSPGPLHGTRNLLAFPCLWILLESKFSILTPKGHAGCLHKSKLQVVQDQNCLMQDSTINSPNVADTFAKGGCHAFSGVGVGRQTSWKETMMLTTTTTTATTTTNNNNNNQKLKYKYKSCGWECVRSLLSAFELLRGCAGWIWYGLGRHS